MPELNTFHLQESRAFIESTGFPNHEWRKTVGLKQGDFALNSAGIEGLIAYVSGQIEDSEEDFLRAEIDIDRRYTLGVNDIKLRLSHSQVMSETLSLYYMMIPDPQVKTLFMKIFNVVKDYHELKTFRFLKKVGDYAKLNITFDEKWRYLAELGALSGFIRPSAAIQLKHYEAFVGKREYTRLKTKTYLYDWGQSVKKWVIRNLAVKTEKRNKLKAFIEDRANWAVAGATNWDKTSELRSKWGTACLMTTEQLYDRCWVKENLVNKAFYKIENGKEARVIFGGDMQQYLLMSWLMDMYNPVPNIDTTLFENGASEKRRVETWFTYMDNGWYATPIDLKEFDQRISKEEILIVVETLIQTVNESGYDNEFSAAMAHLLSGLKNRTVIEVDGKQHKYTNGLLSGWKLTALIGTIVSWCYNDMSKQLVQRTFGIGGYSDYTTQGDDTNGFASTEDNAYRLLAAYKHYGYDLSPGKYYISKTKAEFLRKEYSIVDRTVRGYPARSITKLLFRSGELKELSPGLDRLQEGIAMWQTCLARSLYIPKNIFLHDMSKRIGHANSHLTDYLMKFSVNQGGINIFEDDLTLGNQGYYIKKYQKTVKDNVKFKYPGITQIVSIIQKQYNTQVSETKCVQSLLPNMLDPDNDKIVIKQGFTDGVNSKHIYGFDPDSEDSFITFKAGLFQTFRSIALKEMTFDDIKGILDPSYIWRFNLLKNRCSKAAFREILQGTFSAPSNDIQTGMWISNMKSKLFNQLILTTRRINTITLAKMGYIVSSLGNLYKNYKTYSIEL